jgi:hypothetical protein
MTSIITGDIVNSQKTEPKVWLPVLKSELDTIGQSPRFWEIFRGDSFQVEVLDISEVLMRAIKIKASLRMVKDIDVRMAIGIGEKLHNAQNIKESNGSAFVLSGACFEHLKKEKQTLAIATENSIFNRDINLYLKLALIIMDNWSVNSAEIVKLALENPNKTQVELGDMLAIKQNAISNRLKRACFYEILEVVEIYKSKLSMLV